jgi:enoyl-CoA hydratase
VSSVSVQDDEIIVREQRALRRITLNRPKALSDPAVGAILIDGAGERALCAGGDIRALYDAAKSGGSLPQKFWSTEYRLDVLIARYPKPVIAVMDGLVMGGGVGLSAHAAHRIVTERSAIAMPEVGIGFFPDVGASFLMARSPGYAGTYLMLTGERMGAADAIYSGLADVYVPAAKLPELPAVLADCRTSRDVHAQLDAMAAAPPPGKLPAARRWIDNCFGADRVEGIVERLAACNIDAAQAALAAMGKMSPTSLKVTLRNIRAALSFERVEESFQQDYRIALACIAGHDFIEGIRAQIVDKDRHPHWRPERIEDVAMDIVDRHFQSLGDRELTFAN